jgi:hypothetical protein
MLGCLAGGLPTAILVGSSIKPWELFTFGTLVGVRRRSALGTLGTLPLRVLSLLTLAVSCLYFASQVLKHTQQLYLTLGFVAVATYLLFTAYVTFRSPRSAILCVAALIANIPVVLLGYFASKAYSQSVGAVPLYILMLCILFVTAWAVFLAARLSVGLISGGQPSNIPGNTFLTKFEQSDHHHCLGSRFVEWQRVA